MTISSFTVPHLDTDHPTRNFLQVIFDDAGGAPVVIRCGREVDTWARAECSVALDRARCLEVAEQLIIAAGRMRASELADSWIEDYLGERAAFVRDGSPSP